MGGQNNPTNYGQGHWLFQIDIELEISNNKLLRHDVKATEFKQGRPKKINDTSILIIKKK